MYFPCYCQVCGCAHEVDWSQVGRQMACRGCGRPMTVPAPMETSGPAAPPDPVVKFRCPSCNRKFATKADLAGKKIRCSGCGAGVRVPLANGEAAAAPSMSALNAFGVVEGAQTAMHSLRARSTEVSSANSRQAIEPINPSHLFEDLESIAGADPSRPPGTVLSSRSELMEQVRLQSADETASGPDKPEKTKKKKKKRKKKTGYFDAMETLKLVAGVGALVGVLALVAWGYPDFRFPVGGLLCVVGFIVYLLGVTSLRQHVAEEGPFKALLFRFFPPYQWWYIATRWGETKDFVAFFGAGMLILSIGSAVIKTSPIGKRAEAADKAYEKAKQGRQTDAPPTPSPIVPVRKGEGADIPTSSPKAEVGDDD